MSVGVDVMLRFPGHCYFIQLNRSYPGDSLPLRWKMVRGQPLIEKNTIKIQSTLFYSVFFEGSL